MTALTPPEQGNLVWKRQLWCYLDERLPKLCWRGFYSLLFMSNRLLLHKSLLTLLLNMPLNWSTSCLFIHLHNADAVLPDLMFLHESWKAHNGSGKQSQIANIVLFLFLGGESIILENEKCHLCGLFQQRKTFFFVHHSHILENTFQYSNLYSNICAKCLAIKNQVMGEIILQQSGLDSDMPVWGVHGHNFSCCVALWERQRFVLPWGARTNRVSAPVGADKASHASPTEQGWFPG